jgi:hypothetical protein
LEINGAYTLVGGRVKGTASTAFIAGDLKADSKLDEHG